MLSFVFHLLHDNTFPSLTKTLNKCGENTCNRSFDFKDLKLQSVSLKTFSLIFRVETPNADEAGTFAH